MEGIRFHAMQRPPASMEPRRAKATSSPRKCLWMQTTRRTARPCYRVEPRCKEPFSVRGKSRDIRGQELPAQPQCFLATREHPQRSCCVALGSHGKTFAMRKQCEAPGVPISSRCSRPELLNKPPLIAQHAISVYGQQHVHRQIAHDTRRFFWRVPAGPSSKEICLLCV